LGILGKELVNHVWLLNRVVFLHTIAIFRVFSGGKNTIVDVLCLPNRSAGIYVVPTAAFLLYLF
jgi:hypothetical protein